MAKKTSIRSTKVAKKAPARGIAAKPAQPGKTAPKPQSRKAGPSQVATRRSRRPYGETPVQIYIAAHAGLETRYRVPPRRAHRAHRPRRAQDSQMELALLWHRGPGRGSSLLPQLSLLHGLREG